MMIKTLLCLPALACLALLPPTPAFAQAPASTANGADYDEVAPGGLYGSSSASGSTVVVNGSGPDLLRRSDGFHAYWWAIVGDGAITARVISLTNTNQYAKAGLIFDESTFYQFGYVIPSGFVAAYDANLNQTSAYFPYKFPMWLRATQQGVTFTVAASQDGSSWKTILASFGGPPQHVGLAVTSHDVTQLATAAFDNVTFTGNVTSIPDFTATTTPLTQSTSPGSPVTFTTSFVPRNGYTGEVGLDASPSAAVLTPGATIQPAGSVPFSTPVPGSTTVVITPALNTPPGTYPTNISSFSLPAANINQQNNISFTVTGNLDNPPAGAAEADIGSPPAAGSSSFSNGVLSLQGSGYLSVNPDQFHYYFWTMTGDGSLTARLTSLAGTTSNLKAGIMMRQSLYNASEYVMASAPVLHGGQVGMQLQYRDPTVPGNGVFVTRYTYHNLPIWMRLTRLGGVYEVRWSTDGQTWELYNGSFSLDAQTDNHTVLNDPIYVGFATDTAATFDNIGTTGDFGPATSFTSSPLNPSTLTVARGTNAVFTASVSPVNGFAGKIVFAARISTAFATPSISPVSVTGGGSTTITIPTTDLAGTYTVTVTATYQGVVYTQTATLTVQ